ncbi:hypothetical protein SXCC_00891 [Gluconacetobacter sp. SXCC-1]|nr:hypothetical protein SXCC_00891 [Gluconacetobacter sp. SXCC-1]
MKHPADDQDVAGQALPEKPQGTPPFFKRRRSFAAFAKSFTKNFL